MAANNLRNTLLLLIPPVVLIILFLLVPILQKKPMNLFPNPIYKTKIGSYTDNNSGGNSSIELFQLTDNNLTLTYSIGEAIQFPYAGVSINPGTWDAPFDISGYDQIILKIKTSQEMNINVSFKCRVKNITIENEENSLCPLIHPLSLNPDQEEYIIKIADLAIPDWWLKRYPEMDKKQIPQGLKQIMKAGIQDNKNPPNIRYTLTIKEISVHTDNWGSYWKLGLLLILYPGVVLIIKLIKKETPGETKVSIPHKPLEVKNYSQEELEKITNIIEENYQKTDLSIGWITETTGLSSHKITKLLKDNFNKTFKQLINEIRIKESKRLLLETDRTINDIGYMVGYNNITYFNTLFKQLEGVSPKEYRKSKI